MRAGTQINETVEPMIARSPQFDPHSDRTTASTVPPVLRVPAIILRALFLGALIVIVARLSTPQSETIWAVHETTGDLIRVAVGFAACMWLLTHIFILPKDAAEYRNRLYFGLVSAPLVWVIAVLKW
jgi:hypothetical protein